MRAIIRDDGSLAFTDGAATGLVVADVPEEFHEIARRDPGRLVWTGGRVEDAAYITVWWIGPDGSRRAFKAGDDWQSVNGTYDAKLIRAENGSWSLQSAADARKAALYAHAAKRRWGRETSGITVGQLSIPTDERTQSVLTAAYARAKADKAYSIPRWKLGPGVYAPLSNAQIVALGEAVVSHVQACFDLNADVDALIASGEITVETQIDALFAAI
jgi:hypothetical protein